MKTLILNGSPRANGDTASLIKELTKKLPGEYKIVNAYQCDVSPCVDCRILIASPVYFSELTGKLLDLGSRLQTYYCAAFFRKEKPIPKEKKGAVILVGGGDGHMEKAYSTARTLLHHMNCQSIHDLVSSHNTNTIPAVDDPIALQGIDSIVDFFTNPH